jgi:hypothetical protein
MPISLRDKKGQIRLLQQVIGLVRKGKIKQILQNGPRLLCKSRLLREWGSYTRADPHAGLVSRYSALFAWIFLFSPSLSSLHPTFLGRTGGSHHPHGFRLDGFSA